MGQLHHHAEYRRAPRPGRSISTRSSPRSRPTFRVTSRVAASPSSPRAASIGRDENFPSGTYVELYRVTGTTEVSRAEFALSGKVTRLGLAGENLDDILRTGSARRRSTPSPSRWRWRNGRSTTAVSGDRIPVGAAARRPAGRAPADRARHARRATARRSSCRRRWSPSTPSTPSAASSRSRRRSPMRCGATASSSTPTWRWPRTAKSVAQILGAGNASQRFQRFELKQLPLTYRAAANEIGAAAELDGARRRRRLEASARRCYGAAPDRPRLHAVDRRAGPRFRRRSATACAARGCRAASTTCGPPIARASAPTAMSPPASLTQLMTRPLGLKSVSNPLAAEGGTDPERGERGAPDHSADARARWAAPCRCSTMRISPAPSAASPRRRPQVLQRARRADGRDHPRRAAAATPLTPASPVWQQPARRAQGERRSACRGDACWRIRPSTFRLGLKVKCDPAYESDKVLCRGRGGAARALLLRCARARPAGAAIRGHRGRRRRCPASSRST